MCLMWTILFGCFNSNPQDIDVLGIFDLSGKNSSEEKMPFGGGWGVDKPVF